MMRGPDVDECAARLALAALRHTGDEGLELGRESRARDLMGPGRFDMCPRDFSCVCHGLRESLLAVLCGVFLLFGVMWGAAHGVWVSCLGALVAAPLIVEGLNGLCAVVAKCLRRHRT